MKTFEEFYKEIQAKYKWDLQTLDEVSKELYSDGVYKEPFDDVVLSIKWVTGGMTGGSCWDEGPHNNYARTPDPEPNWDTLDKIIETYVPNLLYKDFAKIAELIGRTELYEYGYYGNSTIHSAKYLKIKDLYDFLVTNEYLK